MKRSSFGAFVRSVTSSATNPPVSVAGAAATPLDPKCMHLFQRGWCVHCKGRSTFARGRRHGAAAPGRPRPQRIRRCMPEKDEQQLGLHLLVSIGCRYDKTGKDTDIWVFGTRRPRTLPKTAHSTFTTPGTPDVLAHLPLVARHAHHALAASQPRFVWWEVKAEDGTPSDAQLNFEAVCRSRGIAHVMGGHQALRAFLVKHGFLRGLA